LVQEKTTEASLEMKLCPMRQILLCHVCSVLVIFVVVGLQPLQYALRDSLSCGSCWAFFFQGWRWFSTSLVKPTWPEKTVVSPPNVFFPQTNPVFRFGFWPPETDTSLLKAYHRPRLVARSENANGNAVIRYIFIPITCLLFLGICVCLCDYYLYVHNYF